MVCGKSCASHGKVRKDVGELASSLASAETLPLLSSGPCNSLGSSSTAWETVNVSSEVVASL